MSLNQSVWDGQINVRVVYGDLEFLLYIHRNSYFPLHYPEIANFFDSVVNHDLHLCPIWLEHEDVPIKWNLPAGVLYDLLYLPANSDKRHQWTLRLGIDTPELPYPSRDIIPFSISDGSIDYFSMLSQVIVNQLKQSTFVMNGNAKAMMSLSEQDSKSLWKSISQHDYNGFHTIARKLHPRGHLVQRVPVKVYVAGTPVMIQAPISPSTEERATTLNDLLQKWVPSIFNSKLINATPIIHGVDALVLAEEPLLKIWSTFRHLDNFLYIVVTFSQL